jgi:hypothetical protein
MAEEMTYFETLMQKTVALCMSASLGGVGQFVEGIDTTRLTPTEYVHILAETATRTAGCSKFDPADSFAFASNLTNRVRGVYDRANADQTLDFIGLMTAYMRPNARDFAAGTSPEKAAEELAKAGAIWLDAFLAIEAGIDPNWTPDEQMPAFEPPKPVPVRPGVAPEAIRDPEVRAAYEAWLARRRVFLDRQRAQTLFRQALETRREAFQDYFEEIKPHLGEAGKALSQRAAALKDEALRNSVSFLL